MVLEDLVGDLCNKGKDGFDSPGFSLLRSPVAGIGSRNRMIIIIGSGQGVDAGGGGRGSRRVFLGRTWRLMIKMVREILVVLILQQLLLLLHLAQHCGRIRHVVISGGDEMDRH